MNNKNLLIGVGVAVVVYYLYNQNQKKKLETIPYTDAELDKVAQQNSSSQVEDKPCKKWVQPLCKTTPCPPICGEY